MKKIHCPCILQVNESLIKANPQSIYLFRLCPKSSFTSQFALFLGGTTLSIIIIYNIIYDDI